MNLHFVGYYNPWTRRNFRFSLLYLLDGDTDSSTVSHLKLYLCVVISEDWVIIVSVVYITTPQIYPWISIKNRRHKGLCRITSQWNTLICRNSQHSTICQLAMDVNMTSDQCNKNLSAACWSITVPIEINNYIVWEKKYHLQNWQEGWGVAIFIYVLYKQQQSPCHHCGWTQ